MPGKKVRVVVDSRLRVRLRDLPEAVRRELEAAFTHENPEFAKKRARGYSTWKTPPQIRTWRAEGRDLTLPRGGMGRLRDVLADAGLSPRFADRRERGAAVSRPVRYVGPEPRDYQARSVRLALERNQGIVRAATGTGKTLCALLLAAESGVNTLIVVPTKGLVKQTAKKAEEWLDLRGGDVGIVAGGKRKLRTVTVALQQSLWSRADPAELDFFGCVIVDEAHHAAARTHQAVIDLFPARYRVAFTADEKRKDRKEFLVYDAFGDVLHEVTRAEAEEKGAILDVEVRLVPTEFEAPWYLEELEEDAPDPLAFKRLVDEMSADGDRNALILGIVAEEVGAGEQAIVLTHRREHASALDRGLVELAVPSGLMLGGGGADLREFELTREGLRNGAKAVGVGTYEALGEGIDLPAVAAGVAATPMWTNKQRFNQVRGRLCRPSEGKERGRLYVPFDRRVFGERALANILAWNRTVTVRHRGRWVDARPRARRRAIIRGA